MKPGISKIHALLLLLIDNLTRLTSLSQTVCKTTFSRLTRSWSIDNNSLKSPLVGIFIFIDFQQKMATLLTRPIDREWINQAHRNRCAIKVYEFNKMSNATAVRALKGASNLEAIDHRFDHGDKAKSAVLRASRHLGTEFPGAEGKLKRDYLMLKDAKSMYLVGNFTTSGRLQVAGNEAWMVEMFYDILEARYEKLPNRFPIYMYNLYFKCWCQLTMGESKKDHRVKEPRWLKISRPPRPIEEFVGIGIGSGDRNTSAIVSSEIGMLF